jgi:hypothetical protein
MDFPSKKPTRKKNEPAPALERDWWVNYDLDEAMTLECKQWIPTFEELDDLLSRFIEEGYKLQIMWDARNHCHACYCYVIGENTPNKGLILTGRGSAPMRAVRNLLFKHYKALKGVWPRPERQRRTTVIDD